MFNTRTASMAIACLLAAAAISGSATAEPCPDLERARQATYMRYSVLILNDLGAMDKAGAQSANVVIGKLEASYRQGVSAGDMMALRKLIALGFYTARAARAAPLDATFRLVFELAKSNGVRPALILDPLTCAVAAVDGPRQSEQRNRALAKDMISLAAARIEGDPNRELARKIFDEVSPIVAKCSE